jgi:protein-S-isoprenylcysteine O-methyltransferase Ste14
MSLVDLLHSVTTGSSRRRTLLTPVGLALFGGTLLLLVFAGRYVDAWLGLPPLMAGRAGLLAGLCVAGVGILLCGSCIALFLKARGTPVPFNPPHELITVGPYAHARNPMLTGVFATLLGVGLLLHSAALVFLVTPMFIVANVVELRLVEEPELTRRFGARYAEYRRQIPMFVPGLRLTRGPLAGPASHTGTEEHD